MRSHHGAHGCMAALGAGCVSSRFLLRLSKLGCRVGAIAIDP